MEMEIKKEPSHVSLILGEIDESTSLTYPSQQHEGKKKEEEKREGNVWERRERVFFFTFLEMVCVLYWRAYKRLV